MEGVVNSPCCWQREAKGYRRNPFLDAEGSISFGVQLGSLIRETQVSGFQPYLISYFVLIRYLVGVLRRSIDGLDGRSL